MQFHLVDQILDIDPGKSLRGIKLLTLGEEYLADHFPTFPVMPGVLMLQSLVEASAFLWNAATEFAHSVITLREVRQVKYGNFMQPGNVLELHSEVLELQAKQARFKGRGVCAGAVCVSAQLTLVGSRLEDHGIPDAVLRDAELEGFWKKQYSWLLRRSEVAATAIEPRK